MSVELTMLVYAVILTIVQMLVGTTGTMMQLGLPRLAGNRDGLPEITGWAGRAQRAHRNMLENLVLFGALVMAVQFAGINDATTALGTQMFFWSRVAYAVLYVAGVPWARTLAWAASMVGLVLLLISLI